MRSIPKFLLTTTKTLFHKTIKTLKSVFSSAHHRHHPHPLHYYNRLPKIPTPSIDTFCCTTRMVDDDDHDDDDSHARVKTSRPVGLGDLPPEKEYYPEERTAEQEGVNGDGRDHIQGRRRRCLVLMEKLKELEMTWRCDVDSVLDIEEVLHYYSRLTCPAYLDILDKFFMEMYADFFRLQHQTTRSITTYTHAFD